MMRFDGMPRMRGIVTAMALVLAGCSPSTGDPTPQDRGDGIEAGINPLLMTNQTDAGGEGSAGAESFGNIADAEDVRDR